MYFLGGWNRIKRKNWEERRIRKSSVELVKPVEGNSEVLLCHVKAFVLMRYIFNRYKSV